MKIKIEQITILIVLILIVIAALIMVGYRRVLKMEERIEGLEKVLLMVKKGTLDSCGHDHTNIINENNTQNNANLNNTNNLDINNFLNNAINIQNAENNVVFDNTNEENDNISINSMSDDSNDSDDIDSDDERNADLIFNFTDEVEQSEHDAANTETKVTVQLYRY